MPPFGHKRYGEGELGAIEQNVVRAEVYLLAKFHLDPFNRLVTVHYRHRQDRTDTDYGLIA